MGARIGYADHPACAVPFMTAAPRNAQELIAALHNNSQICSKNRPEPLEVHLCSINWLRWCKQVNPEAVWLMRQGRDRSSCRSSCCCFCTIFFPPAPTAIPMPLWSAASSHLAKLIFLHCSLAPLHCSCPLPAYRYDPFEMDLEASKFAISFPGTDGAV